MSILIEPIIFKLNTKKYRTKGFLDWQYNPFRNYRLEEKRYFFENKFYTKDEITKIKDQIDENNLPSDVQLFQKGQLIDFQTKELKFDINHPVNVLAQHSYDGSVNLIINDSKNKPRLINSRFSPLGMQKYQIVDRKGVNDTNI